MPSLWIRWLRCAPLAGFALMARLARRAAVRRARLGTSLALGLALAPGLGSALGPAPGTVFGTGLVATAPAAAWTDSWGAGASESSGGSGSSGSPGSSNTAQTPDLDPPGGLPPLQTVAEVDLARYTGTWYEIARLPNRFQAQCLSDVTATYALEADGTVSVINRCNTASGESRVRGVARVLDDSRARLQVSFLPAWLRWLPVGWGDYQVLALDEDYQWVLVGEPSRRYLWVLAREPELETERLQDLLAQAARQGFAVDAVVLSRQP